MSLTLQLSNLATRIGTEFKSVRTSMGSLTSLSTTDKSSLVSSINEVYATVSSGGSILADAITDATTIGKSVLRAATAADARNAIGAGTSNLAIGTTAATAKAGDYAPAWGDVTAKPVVIAAGETAADARTVISVSSTSEMNSAITTAINNLIDGAPIALDTLKEIADYLAANDTAVEGITSALSNRVRVDAAQSFTEPQKLQGRSNIDVYSKSEIGNPETNLVGVFEAALV